MSRRLGLMTSPSICAICTWSLGSDRNQVRGSMATTLVTGGAGYIGSHMVYALLDRGEQVVVLDNLSTGVRAQVGSEAIFVEGDAADQKLVREIARVHAIESVIHFAGSIVVPESVEQPLRYYANNAVASRALIEASIE